MAVLGLTMAGIGSALGSGLKSGLSSAASGMITGAVGGLFGGIKAKKQHKRNKEILALQNQYEIDRMNLQADLNKEQADYSQGLQKDMYDYTFDKEAEYNDPSAQVERLRTAGLNPALMYGGSGATGSASGTTGGAHADGVAALQPMGLQVALQAEMQKAQIDALNAQTLKTNTETAKTASEIEKTKSETNLNKERIEETISNINALEERVRASKVSTKEQEYKNEILERLKDRTYLNENEIGEKYNLQDVLANLVEMETWNKEIQLNKERAEMIKERRIQERLAEDVESIVKGEVDRLTIPSEQKKLLKKQYERDEWELKNDKALGDIINTLGGDDKYSKLLQSVIKWLFSK
jgi:hypothetical protein